MGKAKYASRSISLTSTSTEERNFATFSASADKCRLQGVGEKEELLMNRWKRKRPRICMKGAIGI